MRSSILCGVTLLFALSRLNSAEEKTSTGAGFALPEIEGEVAASRFSAEEIAAVNGWIKRLAPECPPEVAAAAAEGFLAELNQRYPDHADRLLTGDFSEPDFASMLLRHVGTKLTGASRAALRETIALQRLAVFLKQEAKSGPVAVADPAQALADILSSSSVQHRRLLEGRLEDEDLRLLLGKINQPAATVKAAAPTPPKELTAADIVSEFVRRNQTGSAAARFQAYTVEGRFTDAAGEVYDLHLFKMRPDRFRLVVRQKGRTRSILAGDGEMFWVQSPGQPARVVTEKDLGDRRYLREFLDPLFVGDGFAFERLLDGEEAGKGFHRIAVRRADGSGYVARIDRETFHVIAREQPDQSVVRYSDHREIAGMTLAFHEEAVDSKGGRHRLVVTRITPNPGLIRDFFQPPSANQPTYLEFEAAGTAAIALDTTGK